MYLVFKIYFTLFSHKTDVDVKYHFIRSTCYGWKKYPFGLAVGKTHLHVLMPIYFARKGNYLSKIYFRGKTNATIVHNLEKYLYCLKKSFASECILWIMASAKYIFFQ